MFHFTRPFHARAKRKRSVGRREKEEAMEEKLELGLSLGSSLGSFFQRYQAPRLQRAAPISQQPRCF